MKTSRVACVTALLLAVSAACAPTAPPAPSESGKAGGQAIIGGLVQARVLNPILLTDLPSGAASGQIYESLIALNKDTGLPEPRLPERVGQSADRLTVRVVPRVGLQW